MQETAKAINELGLSVVIAAVFIWDWVVNRQAMREILEELKQSNINISKSLEIVQHTIDNQTNKLDSCKEKLHGIANKLDDK